MKQATVVATAVILMLGAGGVCAAPTPEENEKKVFDEMAALIPKDNLVSVDALHAMDKAEYKKLFAKHKVLSNREYSSREEIRWERYVKQINPAVDVAAADDWLDAARCWLHHEGAAGRRPERLFRGALMPGATP